MGFMDKIKGSAQDLVGSTQKNIEESNQKKEDERRRREEAEQLLKVKQEEALVEQQELEQVFRATKVSGDLEIDSDNKLFKIKNAKAGMPKKSGKLMKTGKVFAAVYTAGLSVAAEKIVTNAMKPDDRIFRFDEIIDYELIEDDSEVTSGGLGRAVVGGALLGAGGAIAAGVTGKKKSKKITENLVLKITLDDILFPAVMITYINKSTKVNSKPYVNAFNQAQESISCLDYIIKQVEKGENMSTQSSSENAQENTPNSFDQIKQLKELLDMGAISQDEFNEKKAQLLAQ